MSRNKNHLNTAFAAKIHGILYGGYKDEVTPAELVLYLIETHQENGLYKPITRDQLSVKVKGREHYFTEVYSNEKPGDTLPRDFAVALANLTGTEPFFWQGTTYSLSQAEGLAIDMTRDIKAVPENRVSDVHPLGHSKKQGREKP